MIFILDTNIFQQDYLLSSSRFEIFRDYLARTKSKVVIPRIVKAELNANYQRDLNSRLKQYKRAKGHLLACILGLDIPDINIDSDYETHRYFEFLLDQLEIDLSLNADYKIEHLNEVVNKSVNRIRPCSDKGEEIRDALLWCSVKDVARVSSDTEVVFISSNTKQFSSIAGTLHEDLIQEVEEERLQIHYFSSLSSFIEHHAKPIDFITDEWIKSLVDFDLILQESEDCIISNVTSWLFSYDYESKGFTGYAGLSGGDLDLESFYVYELLDGSFIVPLTLIGEVEIELEVEKRVEKEDWSSDTGLVLSTDFQEFSRDSPFLSRYEYKYEHVYPMATIVYDLLIKDKSVVESNIVNCSVDIPSLA